MNSTPISYRFLLVIILVSLATILCKIYSQSNYREFSSVQEALNWASLNKTLATEIKHIAIISNNDKADLCKLRSLNNNSHSGLFSSLERIELTVQTDTLPDNCFYDKYSGAHWLTSFSAPNLIGLGNWSFRDCINLQEVRLPQIKSIGDFAFYNSGLTNIFLPETLSCIKSNPFLGCSKLTEIVVEPQNRFYLTEDGVLYTKTKNTLLCYPQGKIKNSFNTPVEVDEIHNNAFGLCSNLVMLDFCNVTNVQQWALEYCNTLKKIVFNADKIIGLESAVLLNVPTTEIDLYLNATGIEYQTNVEGNYWKLYEWKSINNNYTALKKKVDVSEASQIVLYPNPVNSTLRIDTQHTIRKVTIYNMHSNVLLSLTEVNSNKIDLSSLPIGMYAVKVDTNIGTKTELIIKK